MGGYRLLLRTLRGISIGPYKALIRRRARAHLYSLKSQIIAVLHRNWPTVSDHGITVWRWKANVM